MNIKKLKILFALFLLMVVIFALIFNKNEEKAEVEPPIINIDNDKKTIFEEDKIITEEELLREEFNEHLAYLDEKYNGDIETWYTKYKELVMEYYGAIEIPETIYHRFSQEELSLLLRVVQAEVGDEYGFEEKVHVANVIFNRLEDSRFPDNIVDILSPSQFATVKNERIYLVEVSDTTKNACEFAYMFGDRTNGAIYFEGLKSNVHDSYAEFIFQDNAHKFYK